MAKASNLISMINLYTSKSKSPFIDFKELCIFVKKYAEHNIEEVSDLVKYLGNPVSEITTELKDLEARHLIAVVKGKEKQTIVSIQFFTAYYIRRYADILKNETITFPTIDDLPKHFPLQVLETKNANEYISKNMNRESVKSPLLYIMRLGNNVPSILLPASVPVKSLIEAAQKKIKRVLRKTQYHDYFLKKLRSTNTSKELTVKNFYTRFVDDPVFKYTEFAEGDDYYIANQLLYYIRQDFAKIPDRTPEDVNVLQSGKILEIQTTLLKEKIQKEQRKQEALKVLENSLNTAPYFYSMQQILKFQDKNGRLLYGRYSEDDLKEFIQRKTTEGENNELPPLLIFRIASGTRYYVYKKNIIQVIVRLCNEAHVSIEKIIENQWHKELLKFEKVPEMSDSAAFEKMLHELVKENFPILFSLLNANFITLLSMETKEDNNQPFTLFENGQLAPYSSLLMLYNNKILADAKRRLPFYYSLPIIPFILRIFSGKKKKNKAKKQNNTAMSYETSSASVRKPEKTVSRQEEISTKAKEISREFVPSGSSIDKELQSLVKQWNRMLAKEAYKNLTEDVNSLIRDYTRHVVRTLSAKTFTKERIEGLAETLVSTPNMKKISEDDSLKEYVTLYIIRLLINIK